MLPKPRYLDLQQQLCSAITLHKELIFDNKEDGLHLQLFERVTYLSNQRMIDLTQTIVKVIRKTYGMDQQCQIYVYDPFVLDFRLLAFYPQENSIVLGEQFLQADTLLFEIRHSTKISNSSDQSEQEMTINNYDLHQQQREAAGPQQKPKRRKTVKEMLQVVEQWRKLNIQYDYKLSIDQAADILGLKRRTLQFYIHCAKVGEKYGYQFHLNLDKKICDVDKFLKEKNQAKKHKQMEMLQKFKHLYK